MQCPVCGTKAEAGTKFCEQCGAQILQVCENCGATVSASAKFCRDCGTHLSDPRPAIASTSEEDKAPLARRHESAGGHDAERRQLTVLFCDLVGSTSLAEQLDPEELRDLMQAYQRTCGEVIARYEGHVAQYLGDGLMVYFGWPRAHEDDAVRAIRAGLEVVEAVSGLNAAVPIRARVGIHTGLVVVGETGQGDASIPKAAVGETPNIAARLQSLAEPSSVVVSERTRSLAGGLFDYVDMGPHPLKGVSEPFRLCRVLGTRPTESRFDAARDELALTPLVGRDEEMELLLRRWAKVKTGEGQVVLVTGEPGIGKSRLTRVLREHIAADAHTILRYQCSPYHVNSALFPIIEQFERAADFGRDDTPDHRLDKMEALLVGPAAQVAAAPLFAAMLSLPVDRYPTLTLSPQKQKQKTLEALADQVEALAQKQPVLMVVEDAHWIDPTTQEALDLLLPRLQGIRVLLVITYRPEYTSVWIGQANVSSLALSRLNRREGAQLIARITRGKALPAEVLDQILTHTDGVPLFIEELTKSILESKLVREGEADYILEAPLPALAIPTTLRDSLVARLDRLAPIREVAQMGACIGREFTYELLAAVSPLKGRQLNEALEQLTKTGLVLARGVPPSAVYTFKHALVQDAAYDSLLRSKRSQLHARIARVLEKEFPELIGNEPEVIARHYTDAGLYDQAVKYWAAAADRALQRWANAEAIAHARKGLEVVRSLPAEQESDQHELILQTTLGMALGCAEGYAAAEIAPVFSRARELCGRVGQSLRIFPILVGLWVHLHHRTDYRAAESTAQQILDAAAELNNANGTVLGHWTCCGPAYFQGQLRKAARHGDAGWTAYDPSTYQELARTYGHNPGPGCADWAAAAYWYLGYPDKGRSQLEQAVQAAVAVMHPPTISTVLVHAAMYAYEFRDYQTSLDRAEAAIALCTQTGIPLRKAEADIFKGAALAMLGDPEHGIPLVESGLAAWNKMGSRILNVAWYTALAHSYRRGGRRDDARGAVGRAREELRSSGELLYGPELCRTEGLLHLDANAAADAEACFRNGIQAARMLESKSMELRLTTSLAALWQSQGLSEQAHQLLAPIYNWFTEGFDTRDLREAKALLDELG